MKQLSTLIIGLILLTACSEDQKTVNIALKKDGKTYLYSILNSQLVEQQLAQGQMPTMMNSTAIVPQKGQILMDASKINTIANILGGNIQVFDKQERSFDGYFSLGEQQIFNQSLRNEDIGEIGKVAGIVEIVLRNQQSTYNISYQITPELKAIENCEVKSLTVPYSENSTNEFTSKDFVMVNLEDINQFFGGHYSMKYDKEASLLYVEEIAK